MRSNSKRMRGASSTKPALDQQQRQAKRLRLHLSASRSLTISSLRSNWMFGSLSRNERQLVVAEILGDQAQILAPAIDGALLDADLEDRLRIATRGRAF